MTIKTRRYWLFDALGSAADFAAAGMKIGVAGMTFAMTAAQVAAEADMTAVDRIGVETFAVAKQV